MKLKKPSGEFTYHCPNCKRILVVGKISSMCVACPDCRQWINYDPEKKEIVNFVESPIFDYGGVATKKEHHYQTYGRDKLSIDQMHSTLVKAVAAGHSHFFTGKPCRNGHMAPRTKRGECNECGRICARKSNEKKKKRLKK